MQVLNDLNLEGLEKYYLNYAMLLSDYQTAELSWRLNKVAVYWLVFIIEDAYNIVQHWSKATLSVFDANVSAFPFI